MKSENTHGIVQVGTADQRMISNYLEKPEEKVIDNDYAISSDIYQLQPIEFDMIFSKEINHVGTNYIPVEITNQTVATIE